VREPRIPTPRREWRAGTVRPIPGNAPHDRPVSRGISSSLKERLRPPLTCHSVPQSSNTEAPRIAFSEAWRNLSVRCGPNKTKPQARAVPPPVGRPGARVKERAGRITPFSSSAMSSGRLFLDRVARQQSPSPLHRRPQNNTHSAELPGKGDISTLLGRGHFYFALTHAHVALTACGQWSRILPIRI
jgi:hypothetical protein